MGLTEWEAWEQSELGKDVEKKNGRGVCSSTSTRHRSLPTHYLTLSPVCVCARARGVDWWCGVVWCKVGSLEGGQQRVRVRVRQELR